MPTGTMRIQYLSYSSVSAAKSVATTYQKRATDYNAINHGIASTYELGVYYDCQNVARQDTIANRKLCESKQQAFTQFAKALEVFYSQTAHTDRQVAVLWGYTDNFWKQFGKEFSDAWGEIWGYVEYTKFLKLFNKLFWCSDLRDGMLIVPVLDYLLRGRFDIPGTANLIIRAVNAGTKWYKGEIQRTVDLLVKTGFFSKEQAKSIISEVGSKLEPLSILGTIANAANIYTGNYRQYTSGEISYERMMVEATIEGATSSLLSGALIVTLGPVGGIVAHWALNTVSEQCMEKGLAENIGDFAGAVTEGVGMLLGEASYQISNAVDNVINTTADWFSGGLIKNAEKAFSNWFS